MRRRRHSRWIVLLLPLLAARLVLPPGVMPGHTEVGAVLVVCSGHQVSGLGTQDRPAPTSDHNRERAVCAFAAACPPAPVPMPAVLALDALVPAPFAAPRDIGTNARSGPPRSQSSRAPPA